MYRLVLCQHTRFCWPKTRHVEQMPPDESSRRVARNETPFSTNWSPAFDGIRQANGTGRYSTRWAVGQTHPQPDTDMQALMETAPHEDVPESTVGQLVLKERLAGAVDALPERLRWIFEATHYRAMSVRQIARELCISKTHVHRLQNQAIQQLRESLT